MEDLNRARSQGLLVRPSLSAAYNKVLDLIGPSGLAFRRPMGEEATAAPAAAAATAESAGAGENAFDRSRE